MENNKEILCIPGADRNYAVEFAFIKEICSDVHISKVPCLPECFIGVFHYRGSIVPVIRLEEIKEGASFSERMAVLVIEYQKYQLGIQIIREPYMLQLEDLIRIETPDDEAAGAWVYKAFYKENPQNVPEEDRHENRVFSVADVKKMMEHLIIYPAL